ncbi:hypothetical protein [Paenibacillus thermotolerans]|uniref:hypothetical protein n=1 Tax=Paenibacillus thermotolerans TaxID=3027807 RepID=UPI002367F531|nr:MULTISPECIES: hypothetical protein [unclassified Paenibacillus]
MKWGTIIDLFGTASKIGLLLSFCAALWLEAAGSGNEELKRLVSHCAAIFVIMMGVTLTVYVWEIARKRNRRSGSL